MSQVELAASSTPATPVPRFLLVVLVIVALLALIARLIPAPRTIDDAFITFRYSRNLVEGKGFVYNPGTRTLGTTTPLYTLLMAGIGLVSASGQYPWFALAANAIFDAVTAALLALLAYRLTKSSLLAAILGGLWALSPMSVTFAVGGMETSAVIVLGVAAAYCYLARHDRWMAFFAALGLLTRIDALLWIGPLLLHQLVTHWRETRTAAPHGPFHRLPWQGWGIFLGVALPWYLFCWAYFGALLPRSLSAKQVAYVVADWQALTRLLQHVATPFFEHETFGIPGIVVGLLLYPGLSAVGTLYAAKRQPRLLPFLVYPWLYIAIFSAMNPLIFRWYLAPLLPAYFMAILLGIWVVAGAISAALHKPGAVAALVAACGILFGVLSLNAWTLHPDHGPDRPAPKMAWHEIELDYKRMGERLRDQYHITEDTLVAAGDIGAVGYYSRARILDTVGLITPEVSRYYPLDKSILIPDANYAVPPAIINDYQPDYLVMMEMFVRNGLEREPEFHALYVEDTEAFIPTDFYGKGMLLYVRRDLVGDGSGTTAP